jgi:hypothetical protein
MRHGEGHRLGAAADAELAVEVSEVGLHGARADEKLHRNLGIGESAR